MVRLKLETLGALLFLTSSAQATVLVNPPKPYPQYVLNDSNFEIDYAGNSTGVLSTGTISTTTQGYRLINTAANTANDRIYVDVYSNVSFTVPSGKLIGVTLTNNATNQLVEIAGASVVSGNGAPTDCGAGNCFNDKKAAIYTSGSVVRISFNLDKLCPTSSGSDFCNKYATLTGDRIIETIKVNFGVVDNALLSSNVSLASGTGSVDSGTFTLGVSDLPPQMGQTSCPSDFYFPGDGEISFSSGKFSATVNSGASGNGADVMSYLVMAKEGGVTAGEAGISTNTIVSTIGYNSGTVKIEGFTNTTNGTDHEYDLIVHAQNRAGIISAIGASASGASCKVQTQEINGVLTESKCFIATAAYHDGRARPVMMLRKFRDRILSKFNWGRHFIREYYSYSPALAVWAWDKPFIRTVALKALIPVELMAWAILKVSGAEEVQSDAVQPYINRVKKKLGTENDSQPTESYTEIEKKKLEAESKDQPVKADSYIERVKKSLEAGGSEEEKSTDYTIQEKAKLPEESERESPIQMVKDGRDEKLGFGTVPSIKSAMGFKLGVTPGMEVSVQNGTHSFSEVYGTGFRPEMIFHYERQWFHSENFGSLSLGGDFGVAYSGGKGVLKYGVGGNTESRTGFGFFQIPLIIDAVYRFNLLRLVRPFVGAGAGAIFYDEMREDSKTDKKGYTAVYKMNLGASLLLDFFDRKTYRDSYLSNGIQHSYFFLEYLYLNSLKSAVNFKRSGIYAGFLFEY